MCVCTGEKQCVHRNERVSANCLRKRKVGEEKEREREKIKRGKIKRNTEINKKIMLTVSGG